MYAPSPTVIYVNAPEYRALVCDLVLSFLLMNMNDTMCAIT